MKALSPFMPLIFLFACPSFAADGGTVSGTSAPVRFEPVSVSLESFIQNGKQQLFTGEIAWKPIWRISPILEAYGRFGLLPLKNSESGNVFVSAEAEVFLSLRTAKQIRIAAGAGFQEWFGNGGINPEIEGDLAYVFKTPLLQVIDSLGLRFSVLFTPVQTTLVGLEATL